jgi:hypothetical protein
LDVRNFKNEGGKCKEFGGEEERWEVLEPLMSKRAENRDGDKKAYKGITRGMHRRMLDALDVIEAIYVRLQEHAFLLTNSQFIALLSIFRMKCKKEKRQQHTKTGSS